MIEDIAPFFWNWTFFGIWKIICYISRKTLWVNLFSEFFQICIGHWAKTVSAFWLECLEKCCHHCFLRVQINTCRKKFWGKSFSSLPDIEKKCFSLSLTMFRRGCHYCILPLQRIILKIFVKKLFVSQFLTMSKKRWCFCWKIFGQTIIPPSACHGESFEEQQFFKKKLFFFRHQISSEIFSVFCRNFLGRPAKTVIHLSKGTIWEKFFSWEKYVLFYSFSENQSKNSGLVAQFFQWDFKKCMLPIQKRHFDQIFHGNVFASYRHWAGETFFDLWQINISTGL